MCSFSSRRRRRLFFFDCYQLASAAASSNAVAGEFSLAHTCCDLISCFIYRAAELAALKTQLEVALERQSELEEENKVRCTCSLADGCVRACVFCVRCTPNSTLPSATRSLTVVVRTGAHRAAQREIR